MPRFFRAVSCAKINLSLDILGVRPDGYHELRSVVHTLALHDEIRFAFDGARGGDWRLKCDDASLESDANLCLKAARLWSQAAGVELPGGVIELTKRIPYGAGLGGGSGNAWCVLEALGRAFDPRGEIVPRARMLDLAKRLGADVPLFARGGAVLIEGIGEILTPLAPLEAWAVLAQPGERVSTPEAYRAWDESGRESARASEPLLDAWGEGPPLERIAARLGNDLRHAAQVLGVPVEDGLSALRAAGALGAEMTGSGSAVFGLCRDAAHAGEVEAKTLQVLGGGWHAWKAPLCDYGARFEGE